MAWSDAARAAALAVRQAHAQGRANFHSGGTVAHSTSYYTKAYRKGLAGQIRQARAYARKGNLPQPAHRDALSAAAFSTRHRNYYKKLYSRRVR